MCVVVPVMPVGALHMDQLHNPLPHEGRKGYSEGDFKTARLLPGQKLALP